MKIAILQNNIIVKTGTVSELFPDFSFPKGIPDDAFLKENSAVIIIEAVDFDPKKQTMKTVEPYVKDGKVYNVQVLDKTAEELATSKKILEEEVKRNRNQILISTDWTRLDDVSVDKEAWAAYRQALRDITKQPGYPENIIWPVAPSK